MRGSGCATASSASVIGRSGSYFTSIRSSAAVAISSLTAATAATGSPTKRTLSRARACSSWLTGRIPKGIGRSFPVSTAFTPGKAWARDASIRVMRAWAWGLRSSLAYSMRGRKRSSANRVAPVTFAVASTFRSAFPTTRSPPRSDGRTVGLSDRNALSVRPSDCPTVRRLPAIQALRCRLRVLAPQSSRGQLHRLVDLHVAGAAAQVARQGLLHLVTRGSRVLKEKRFGGEQECRRTIPALRGAELCERVLEGMQRTTPCHALDGFHAAPGAGEAEHQTRKH